MKCLELQELLALEALGVLDRVEQARLKALIMEDPDAAAELPAWRDAAAAFAIAATSRRPAPAYIRERILTQIRQTPQVSPSLPPSSGPVLAKTAPVPGAQTPLSVPGAGDARARVTFDFDATAKWSPVPGVPGVRVRLLAANHPQGYRILVVELAPGACFPSHHHGAGPEDLFLLSGDLLTEGRVLGPGDHFHAEPGTDHQRLISPSGCRAMIVEPLSGPQYLEGAVTH